MLKLVLTIFLVATYNFNFNCFSSISIIDFTVWFNCSISLFDITLQRHFFQFDSSSTFFNLIQFEIFILTSNFIFGFTCQFYWHFLGGPRPPRGAVVGRIFRAAHDFGPRFRGPILGRPTIRGPSPKPKTNGNFTLQHNFPISLFNSIFTFQFYFSISLSIFILQFQNSIFAIRIFKIIFQFPCVDWQYLFCEK